MLNLRIFDHGANAVGAQKDAVARFDVQLVDVGLHMRVGPNGSRDNRAVRVNAGFGFCELARFDHVGHKAVVTRELLEFSLVQEVCA